MHLDIVFADIGASVAEQNTQVFKLRLFFNLLELLASCYLLDLLGRGKVKTDPPSLSRKLLQVLKASVSVILLIAGVTNLRHN